MYIEGCCPNIDTPVIPLTKNNNLERQALRLIMYGEIGAAIGRAYVFGFMTGALHLISMWIDYMGYATMHFCQVMVVAFCGGIEAMMLFMNMRDGGPMQAAVFETPVSKFVFWVMLAFALVKCFCGVKIHQLFKKEFEIEHGHTGPQLFADAVHDHRYIHEN